MSIFIRERSNKELKLILCISPYTVYHSHALDTQDKTATWGQVWKHLALEGKAQLSTGV